MANAVEWVLKMYRRVVDVQRLIQRTGGSCHLLTGNAAGLLGGFMGDIRESAPRMSANARALVRSQLPRQRLIYHFMCAISPQGTAEIAKDFEIIAQGGPSTANIMATAADARYYARTAWLRIMLLETAFVDAGGCMRRGCTKSAADNEVACPECKSMRYCSSKCLKRDKAEHHLLCQWMPLLERIRKDSRALQTGNATSGQGVAEFCSIVDGKLVIDQL
ncbi:hypothetical protein C8T65DRAFT_825395 [Cerioporus squamosus]|nr:hypothetical protein C8T65DRAFT_825395 [Cerioporus squamosus]